MNAALAPKSLGRAELVFALGVGLFLVSGLLPWIAASEAIPVADPAEEADGLGSFEGDNTSESLLGIDRVDWVVLAGIGLVATFLAVTEPWSRVVLAVAGISGAAAVGLGAVYLVDPAWMYSDWIKSDVAAVASTGPGVYLAIGGGVAQCVGCYLGYSSSGSTTGAQRLGAPAQPETQPTRQNTPRQGPPADRQPPQRGRSNQPPQTGPRGQPQQRGAEQPPTGQSPEDARPPDEQRPPRGQQPQNQQRRGGQQPPTDDEPRRPSSGGRPNPEQSHASESNADGPIDRAEASDPTGEDSREESGSGQRKQPRDSSEKAAEGGDSPGDTNRQKE